MKNILFSLIFLLGVIGCSEDDETVSIDTTSTTITGEDDGIRIESGISGTQGAFQDVGIKYSAPTGGIQSLVFATDSLDIDDNGTIVEIKPFSIDFAVAPITDEERLIFEAFNVDASNVLNASEFILTVPADILNIQQVGEKEFNSYVTQSDSDDRGDKASLRFTINTAVNPPLIYFQNAADSIISSAVYGMTLNETMTLVSTSNIEDGIVVFELTTIDISQDTVVTLIPVTDGAMETTDIVLTDVMILQGRVVDRLGNEASTTLEIAEFLRGANTANTLDYTGPSQNDGNNIDTNAGLEFSGYKNNNDVAYFVPADANDMMVEISSETYNTYLGLAISNGVEKQFVFDSVSQSYSDGEQVSTSTINDGESKYYIIQKDEKEYSILEVSRIAGTSQANINYFLSSEREVPFDH